MLTRQMHQKNVIFFIIAIFFLDKDFQYEPNLCNGCDELMKKSNFNDISILSVKGNDYRIHY